MERRAHSTSSLDAYFSARSNPASHSNNAGSGHMTPTDTSSTSASIRGGGSEAGSYFSTTPVQSTPRSSGYFTASSTPTRTVRLPQETEEEDDDEEDVDANVNGNAEEDEDEDEDVTTVTATMKALSTSTRTNNSTPKTGSRPSTPSAIGLDFGDHNIDRSPRRTGTRGHQSPVLC